MKRTLLAAVLSAAVAVSFSGCFETAGGSGAAYTEVLGRAEEYVKIGDIDAADNCVAEVCAGNASADVYIKYLKTLAENGRLDILRENFPSEDEIIFYGKPLGEYSTQDLLDMAGITAIGYRSETSLSQTVIYYNASEEEKNLPLPYGITQSMNCKEILTAAGFTEKQAELLCANHHIKIICSDDGFAFDVQKTQYAPFSQHPQEMTEFTVRYGSAELCFGSYGNELDSYTVTVYF